MTGGFTPARARDLRGAPEALHRAYALALRRGSPSASAVGQRRDRPSPSRPRPKRRVGPVSARGECI